MRVGTGPGRGGGLLLVVTGLCWGLTGVGAAPTTPQVPHPIAGDVYTDLDTEGCDWTVWDTPGKVRGVRSMRAGCSEGQVDWRSPYGALRVALAPPAGHTDFEACFLVTSHFAKVKISMEEQTSGLDISEGTLAGPTTLRELVVLGGKEAVDGEEDTLDEVDDVDEEAVMRHEACFRSPRGQVVTMYLETDPSQTAAVLGHVHIEYDISAARDDSLLQDCRPCTEDEILQAACSSDFVVAGEMKRVETIPDAGETRIDLHVSSILRQRLRLFGISDTDKTHMDSHRQFPGVDQPSVVSAGSLVLAANRGRGAPPGGKVWVPRQCGVRRGPGHFVFLGRIRLKRALLQCAPRSEEFSAIWRTATEEGRAPCQLS